MTLRIPPSNSILPYFNVSVCIYAEVNITLTEHVQTNGKANRLKSKSAKTQILTFYRHYQSGEDPIISNEEQHIHANSV